MQERSAKVNLLMLRLILGTLLLGRALQLMARSRKVLPPAVSLPREVRKAYMMIKVESGGRTNLTLTIRRAIGIINHLAVPGRMCPCSA
jgi:hypothetical protein